MSEKFPNQNHESHKQNAETESASAEQSRKNIERIKQLAEQENDVSEKTIEALRETIESSSKAANELSPKDTSENKKLPDFDQGTLKRNSFNKTMANVQAKLPPVERTFSKIVHQKNIEAISNFGGKTAARPSGVLGGGLVACIGTIVVLYFAKKSGFEYNYTLFIALYVIGFGGGILFELAIRLLNRSK